MNVLPGLRLPIRRREKATYQEGWPDPALPQPEIPDGDNVALRLDHLVDLDLDCPEAIAAVAAMNLGTLSFGRPSGVGHYLFDAPGTKPEVFKDEHGKNILELRHGNRQYTVIPPSQIPHKDDPTILEALAFECENDPKSMPADALRRFARDVATIVVLSRHWTTGSRHVIALAVAGFLAARDLPASEIEGVVRAAASLAGDEDVEDRVRAAKDSFATFHAGDKTTGAPTLEASIGSKAIDLLLKWYGCDRSSDFPHTESGDAEAFAALYSDRLRFDHRRGRWLIASDTGIWLVDDTAQLVQMTKSLMRERQRRANEIKDGEKKKQAWMWAHKGESRSRITNTLALAQSVQPISDRGDRWDIGPWLLGAANGVIDLQTGTSRHAAPEEGVTMRVQCAHDPRAACPVFEQTLREIFDHDDTLIAYVQRALGYSISGDCREECFFLLWGEGANGKSTLIGTITFVLAEYADNVPFSALELHDRSGSSIPNDVAKLVNKRFVTASESGDVRLNEARVKALTGRDPITARFLHQEFFTFEPVAKFWLATNAKPEVRDDSEGFWRRVHLIPFTQSFVGREDKTLKDRLRAEAPGILNWLVRGCLAWQREGLNPPDVVLDATREYRNESQQLGRFINALCVLRDGARAQAGEMFSAYKAWCDGERERSDFNQKTFNVEMRKRFKAEEGRHTVFVGVGLMGRRDDV